MTDQHDQATPGVGRVPVAVASRDERAALAHFRDRYSIAPGELVAAIEQQVLGAAWGANGYTTVEQAEELGRRLGLGPGQALLDVGTGRGWPGLYLAARTGCRVVGTDLPLEALRAAVRRAGREGLLPRAPMVAASAANLPFAPETFDAIVHTDVLC